MLLASVGAGVFWYRQKIKMYLISQITAIVLGNLGVSFSASTSPEHVSRATMFNRKVLKIDYMMGGETYELLVPYNRRNKTQKKYTIVYDETTRPYKHNTGVPLLVNDRELGGIIIESE